MKVFIVKTGAYAGEEDNIGVFSSRLRAMEVITGEDVDYERISDTEESFETTDGFFVVSSHEVDFI